MAYPRIAQVCVHSRFDEGTAYREYPSVVSLAGRRARWLNSSLET